MNQKYITTVYIDASNIGALNTKKKALPDIKRETDSDTMIIEDFDNLHMSKDKTFRGKIDKKALSLIIKLNQIYIYIYERDSISSKRVKYIFFSSAFRTFSNINHMQGHKTRLNNFKKLK